MKSSQSSGSPRPSRALALLGSCIVAAGLISGCGGGGGSTKASDAVLRMGISATIDSLNPFVSISDYSAVVYQYVYPQLVEYDTNNLSIQPSFATKWETSPDGLVWTFHTVPGAQWSDGQPLTAKDAAFTLTTTHQFQDGATGKLGGFVRNLTSARATDDNTLVVTYSEPVANVLAQMQQLPILPEHIWSQYAAGDGKALSTFQNDAPSCRSQKSWLVAAIRKRIASAARHTTGASENGGAVVRAVDVWANHWPRSSTAAPARATDSAVVLANPPGVVQRRSRSAPASPGSAA